MRRPPHQAAQRLLLLGVAHLQVETQLLHASRLFAERVGHDCNQRVEHHNVRDERREEEDENLPAIVLIREAIVAAHHRQQVDAQQRARYACRPPVANVKCGNRILRVWQQAGPLLTARVTYVMRVTRTLHAWGTWDAWDACTVPLIIGARNQHHRGGAEEMPADDNREEGHHVGDDVAKHEHQVGDTPIAAQQPEKLKKRG